MLGLLLAALAVVASSGRVNIDIDHSNGRFLASVGGQEWLKGEEISVRSNGQRYSTQSDSAALLLHVTEAKVNHNKKNEVWESYTETSLLLESADGMAKIECRFLELESAVIFEQHFPMALSGTSSPSGVDDLVSSFPSFRAVEQDGQTEGTQKGYSHWVSFHYEEDDEGQKEQRRQLLEARGFVSPVYAPWNSSAEITGGGVSGTGVVAMYTADGSVSTVLSPFSGFMAQSHVTPGPGQLSFGVMGGVQQVPQGYTQATVLYADEAEQGPGAGPSGSGMTRSMKRWGAFMRASYGASDASAGASRDVTLSTLGYSTDNGMYYYYHTAEGDSATYQDTLTRVYDQSVQHGVPYKYILLDSWWYERANNTETGGGVVDWSPRADMFPDGGFEYLHNYTGWWVQAHNRYWSDEAIYATANGGQFEFGIDRETHGAVPLTADFWQELLAHPSAPGGWGLRVYEQDWLDQEMDVYYPAMLRDVDSARQWLMQMAAGARANNVTIQYCMPYVRHLLQSLEVNMAFGYGRTDSNIVTQARASDDHKPSEDEDQWRIAGQAILMDALGLSPSKDGFWSTTVQPGNPYGPLRVEPYPELQSMVATMSAGPVQVGDGLGLSDDQLIMRSCRKDGRLLQADGPSMPIDSAVHRATFGDASDGPDGEVWYAPACFDGFCSHYLSVAGLAADYTLTLAEMQHVVRARQPGVALADAYWVSDRRTGAGPQLLDAANPLLLPACGLQDFHFFSIVPAAGAAMTADSCGWSLLGEGDKWVRASRSRFLSVRGVGCPAGSGSEGGLRVTARGSAGEAMQVSFMAPTGQVVDVPCVFGEVEDGSDVSTLVVGSDGSCARVDA